MSGTTKFVIAAAFVIAVVAAARLYIVLTSPIL